MVSFASFLSAAFIAALCTLSVDSAAIEARCTPGISSAVQLCIDDMQSANEQLVLYNDILNNFHYSSNLTNNQNLQASFKVHFKEQEVETRFKAAGVSCCATPSNTYNLEETEAVLSVVGIATPKLIQALNMLVIKKIDLDRIPLATILHKADIERMNNQTNVFNNCLLARVPISPPNYIQDFRGHFTELNNSFASAKEEYAKKNVPPSSS